MACGILLAGAPSCWRHATAAPLAAAVTIVATWLVALAITWVGPFLAPVGLLALLLPLVIVADHLVPGWRTPAIVMTVVPVRRGGAIGVARWPAYESTHPVTVRTVLIVALFVPLLVSVLVAGLRDYVIRLGDRTHELEESRARLAVAAIEARRSIERDLHDGAQQRLATIAVNLGRVTRLWDQDPPQARTIVHGLQGQLEAAIRDLRDLAHGIYPPHPRRAGPGRGPSGGGPPHDPAVHGRRARRWVGTRPRSRRRSTSAAPRRSTTPTGTRAARSSPVQASDDEGPGRGLRFSITDDGHGFDPAAVRSPTA